MKNFKFFVLAVMCFLLSTVLFAQVVPVDPALATSPDIFSFVLGLIPVKYQAITFTVLTGLFLLEQFLASSAKIKANSTFQLIAGWISAFFTASKNKK